MGANLWQACHSGPFVSPRAVKVRHHWNVISTQSQGGFSGGEIPLGYRGGFKSLPPQWIQEQLGDSGSPSHSYFFCPIAGPEGSSHRASRQATGVLEAGSCHVEDPRSLRSQRTRPQAEAECLGGPVSLLWGLWGMALAVELLPCPGSACAAEDSSGPSVPACPLLSPVDAGRTFPCAGLLGISRENS